MRPWCFHIMIAMAFANLASAKMAPPGQAYDALGRRIVATIGEMTTRYYYDGQTAIEEYSWDGSAETRSRYHVNGGQYIDERVCCHTNRQ